MAPGWTIERVLGSAAIAALAVVLVSGAVVALGYRPSSEPIGGRVYVAATAVLDNENDTLLRAGERIVLDSVPSHRGSLLPVGDTSTTWSAALVSHVLLLLAPSGAALATIHNVSATIFVAAVAVLCTLTVARGYRWRSRDTLSVLLLVGAMVASWLGTTLPADPRAMEAYGVGRSFLADNLPFIGDVVGAVLPARFDAARVFLLHAVWLPPVLLGLLWSYYRAVSDRPSVIAIAVGSIAIVGVGLACTLVMTPVVVHGSGRPLWHLGVPYGLLHWLPMDATMLTIVAWWAVVLVCGTSTRRSIRSLGASLIAVWFVGGAIVTIVSKG